MSRLEAQRARVWEAGRALLAACEGRDMSVDEEISWERINRELDRLDAQRAWDARRRRQQTRAEVLADMPGAPDQLEREAQLVRRFLTRSSDQPGAVPVLNIPVDRAAREARLIDEGVPAVEARALLWDTGSVGSAVPTSLARTIYAYMEAQMAMWAMPTFKLNTESGETMHVAKITTHGLATHVIAQGTAVGGTDPVFDRVQFDAFKYGQLVTLGNEVIQDAGVDIIAILGANMGRAIGRVVGPDLVVGTGTGEPRGVMTAIAGGGAGSVTTGGSLIPPTYENVVDLAWTVNSAYRADPSAAWLMNDATLKVLRKLRDGAGGTLGNPIFQPGIMPGQRDRILDWDVYTDPSVATLGSNARAIGFGAWESYWVRHVGDIELRRGVGRLFATDQTEVRATWQVDGDLMHVASDGPIASLVQNV